MPVVRGRPRVQVSPCRFCSKVFKRQEHLQRHERIHTQEKPFECTCGQSFSRQDLLVRHQRVAHATHDQDAPSSPPKHTRRRRRANKSLTTGINGDGNRDECGEADNNANDKGADGLSNGGADGQDQESMLSMDRSAIDLRHEQGQQGSSVNVHKQDDPGLLLEQPLLSGDQHQPPSDMLIDPILGVDGSPDLEIFWNDMQGFYASLPHDFFDTDFSITDISQRLAYERREEGETMGAPEPLPEAGGRQKEAEETRMDRGVYETLPTGSLQTQPQPLTSMASRLPSLEPGNVSLSDEHSNDNPSRLGPQDVMPWRVSAEMHRRIVDAFATLRGPWPAGFAMPSRHTLSRYLEGYFRGFHEHMPFLHTATFSAATAELELVLALAAVGALYRFEHAKGYELYQVADTIVQWRLGQKKTSALTQLSGCSPYYAGLVPSPQGSAEPTRHQPPPSQAMDTSIDLSTEADQNGTSNTNSNMRSGMGVDPDTPSVYDETRLNLLQAMLVLMALSSWGERSMVPESLSMSSHVSVLAQELGIGSNEAETLQSPALTWHEWIATEGRQRTLFVAYVLTNLQSVAFNVPPAILSQDIGLALPASAPEWSATSAQTWAKLRRCQPPQPTRLFQHTLNALVQGTPPHRGGAVSAFGNYLLMHGLLQQIFFARQTVTPQPTGSLPLDFIKRIEDALCAWQESWEATYESTMDPSSPKGPLGFNSTALLRLAHIRLHANVGPRRQLVTRDPQRIAAAFFDAQQHTIHLDAGGTTAMTPHLDRAVLQCVHAFSVPVRVGIAYVARTQTLNWSIQHALCNLECALLLVRWLRSVASAVAARGFDTLYADQVKLLNMTFTLVRETSLHDDVYVDELDYQVATAEAQAQAQARRIRRLAGAVASLWAETFRGFHVFEMVYAIGAALATVSDTLNREVDGG